MRTVLAALLLTAACAPTPDPALTERIRKLETMAQYDKISREELQRQLNSCREEVTAWRANPPLDRRSVTH